MLYMSGLSRALSAMLVLWYKSELCYNWNVKRSLDYLTEFLVNFPLIHNGSGN